MNFRHIRYFLAVAEELNFTRAAARLCIAQPPLTRQIKDLEAEVGAALFIREGHRTKLTPAGLKLQEEAYHILDQCQHALMMTRAVAAGDVGVILIGYMPVSFCYKPFLETLKLFRSRHPRVQLTLTQMSPVAQLEALRSGRIDFGMVHMNTAHDRGFAVERVFDEPIELLLPVDHHLAKLSQLSMEDIAEAPFIMMTRRWCPTFYDQFLKFWHESQSDPNIVQETESFAVSLELVANGMGVTIGSSALRKSFTAAVQARSLSGLDMRMGADLVWSEAKVSSAMKYFIDALREVKKKCSPGV